MQDQKHKSISNLRAFFLQDFNGPQWHWKPFEESSINKMQKKCAENLNHKPSKRYVNRYFWILFGMKRKVQYKYIVKGKTFLFTLFPCDIRIFLNHIRILQWIVVSWKAVHLLEVFDSLKLLAYPVSVSWILQPAPFFCVYILVYYCLYQSLFLGDCVNAYVLSHFLQAVKTLESNTAK